NFNSSWKVLVGDDSLASQATFNDANWKSVTLPYAWNENDAFKKDIADLSTGIAWYRKHFKLPTTANKKVFIEFEGVRQAAEIYINGKRVGLHENGVMAFGFDITSFLQSGDNVIAVRTDNSWEYKEKATNTKFQWIDKNFNANYGGLSKNVYLHITDKLYQALPLFNSLGTTGQYVYATDFDIAKGSAMIVASSQVKNEFDTPQTFSYQVTVKDINGQLVKIFSITPITIQPGELKTVTASSLLIGLHFWSWGYGYLYTVQIEIKATDHPADIVSIRTGFRKTTFRDGMFYLNDRVMQVHGYAQRTSNEWPAIGLSVPAWMSDYSNGLIVEGNGNLVRWMHITPWKQDIESCDRVGLIEAMPAGDAEKDIEGIRWQQRKAVMRDAIIYNRNNPSIIFYECGNENISEQHMQEMKDIRDEYDPHGGRAIGSREMLDSKVAEYGGEMLYINKSAGKPLWAMEFSRDEGLRKYWDDYTAPYHKDGDGPQYKGQDASDYNRNQESHATENVKRWYEYWKERPGTGKRVSSGGVNIVFAETNTHHRGAENFRRSGEVDALRIKKENYYANQIMWDGWVDVEKRGIHIIGHWNYESTVTKDIFVVSAADKVQLFVNNKSMGYGTQSNRFLYTFKNIHWQKGTIRAIGYDKTGKQICDTKIETAGTPYKLQLSNIQHPGFFHADGHDLALVQVEVVDQQGHRCPTALNLVHFNLSGNAEWRGGMAQGPDNYILSTDLPVECGVNRVLLRSTTQAGKVMLITAADGLKGDTILFQTVDAPQLDGLSTILPSDGMLSSLKRGPAPATPSFKVSRVALTVIAVNAGAHADSAYKSYDDNEMTDWYNDGKLSTAWIEYELDKPAVVNQVNMKLNNFRSRTYPLRILVDGREVFADTTQRSLGYFNAICKPIKGKKVRIELASAIKGKATISMAEVNGKKLDDGVARDDANEKGRLSLIEVEIYQDVK
ncbi:MAG: sugar-binding domain-containing protein, partial [Chitinophagaceae bacterium]